MDHRVCVNCVNKNGVNTTYNRLVTESCGHVKCMRCLLQEKTGCSACEKETLHSKAQNDVSLEINGLTTEDKSKRPGIGRTDHVEEAAEDIVTNEREKMVTNGAVMETDEAIQSELPDDTEDTHAPDPEREDKKYKLNTSHIVITKDGDGKRYFCTLCKKKFSARSHVSYHAYCNGQKKPFECKDCKKSFATFSHYKYHRQSKHPVTANYRGDYRCKVCDARFIQRSKLERHNLRHTKEKIHHCKECEKSFNNRSSLRKHGLMHSGKQPYTCPHCSRRFRDSSNLKKHIYNKHSNTLGARLDVQEKSERAVQFMKRKHQCARCPQAFHTRKDLRRHENIHTDDKQFYACPIRDLKCKQPRFSRRDNYNRHLRNTHGVTAHLSMDDTAPNKQNGTSPENVVTKVSHEIQEKAKLEVLNPLPPLPDEVIQKHLYTECRTIDDASGHTIDNVNERATEETQAIPLIDKPVEKVLDKSYIIEANNARESVICKAQERKPSSPVPMYVHKLKIAHTLTHKEVCLPPIDARKLEQLVKLYPHSKEEPRPLDVCDIRVKDVQTLKNILHEPRRQQTPAVHWRKKRLAPDNENE